MNIKDTNMKRKSILTVAGLLAVCAGCFNVIGIQSERQSKVALVKKLDGGDYGISKCSGLRLGDLDGDNQLDLVLVQNQGQSITSLAAIDITGKRLWQVGKPDAGDCKASFDLPIQIYDIDQDGANEVICVMGNNLVILNGKDGAIEKEVDLPAEDARDCIVFANFSGNSRPRDIVLKNRYKKVWALDKNFEVMWSYTGNTGHYPWPHDFDGDGRDELMCGYAMLNHDGTTRWEANLGGHCDGVAVGNVDGDKANTDEIAFATCGGNIFAVYSEDGKELWSKSCGHSQHIIIGDFREDLPGKEVCGLDRGNDRTALGVDAMVMYSADGKGLWREERTDRGKNRWLTIITMVENWDDEPGDLVLAYRRGSSNSPTLYDGKGKIAAIFPSPDSEGVNTAYHADICGDEREEILVRNGNNIWIYRNSADSPNARIPKRRPQPKRLYNYTHYIGMP